MWTVIVGAAAGGWAVLAASWHGIWGIQLLATHD